MSLAQPYIAESDADLGVLSPFVRDLAANKPWLAKSAKALCLHLATRLAENLGRPTWALTLKDFRCEQTVDIMLDSSVMGKVHRLTVGVRLLKYVYLYGSEVSSVLSEALNRSLMRFQILGKARDYERHDFTCFTDHLDLVQENGWEAYVGAVTALGERKPGAYTPVVGVEITAVDSAGNETGDVLGFGLEKMPNCDFAH